ncbi:MAG: hypothetical protein AB1696_27970 [Planctomycetota bacterium]
MICKTMRAVCILFYFIAVAGCGRKTESPTKQPRPVVVFELKRVDPVQRLRLTGSVEAWKEEDIGFEVDGRVQWAIEEGLIVEGRTFDEGGKMITEGTVLGRLDPTRYELRVESAQAKLAAILAQADATKIEIEQVYRERLKAAEAELARAKMDFERAMTLLHQKAGSAQDADRAKAEFETR